MAKVYGIDLGTTYSCVAYINPYGQPEVIANDLGKRTTPSVVYLSPDNQSCVIGELAKNGQVVDYSQTVSFIKREMGKEFSKPTKFPNGLTPTEISARILRKLVADANNATDGEPSFDVVITCPAYFGTAAREQTKQAGEIAGLNVLRIINEPTAAAVAYGAILNAKNEKKFLIYDLGGGTFDISFVKVCGKDIEVIATDGNSRLGGHDWDLCLAKKMLEEFNNQNGTDYCFENDPALLNSFMLEAEKSKMFLSAKTDCKVNIGWKGESARFTVTRQEFDAMTSHLLEKTVELTQNMLLSANKDHDVSLSSEVEVLLVGGSSRMPQVSERLKRLFAENHCSIRLRDPDECVAKGAALVASSEAVTLFEPTAEQSVILYDVTSKTYGFGCIDRNTHENIIENIIFRNTQLPVEAESTFETVQYGQQRVSIFVYESDSDNETIPLSEGTAIDDENYLEGLPPNLPVDTPILVHYAIDKEGILIVTASLDDIQIEFPVKIKGKMNDNELRRSKSELARTKIDS